MSLTAKAKAAYEKYQKVKKAKDHYDTAKGYYENVKNLLNEDTRPAEIFKLGLDGLMKLGEKAVGQSLTKHPYFAYHKAHLEILGQALTATATHDNAMKALSKAIASADSAQVLSKQVGDLKSRKNALKLNYSLFLAGGLQLLSNHSINPAQAATQIQQQSGGSVGDLRTNMDDGMYVWRAQACELYFDGLDLFAMVDIEYKAATAAYKKYQQKVQSLQQSTKPIDVIAGYGAERKRQYEWLERVQDQRAGRSGGASPEAVEDPSVHAGRQSDLVAATVASLAAICDVAMSPDAYNPNLVTTRIGSL
jgi:hypothetical protein